MYVFSFYGIVDLYRRSLSTLTSASTGSYHHCENVPHAARAGDEEHNGNYEEAVGWFPKIHDGVSSNDTVGFGHTFLSISNVLDDVGIVYKQGHSSNSSNPIGMRPPEARISMTEVSF